MNVTGAAPGMREHQKLVAKHPAQTKPVHHERQSKNYAWQHALSVAEQALDLGPRATSSRRNRSVHPMTIFDLVVDATIEERKSRVNVFETGSQ